MESSVKAPVFVIAFPDRERRKVIRHRLTTLGVKPRFFDAISGNSLTETQRSLFSGSGREKWRDGPMRDGAMGASLSHFCVWQVILDEGLEAAVILEDDAVATAEGRNIVIERINWCYGHRDRLDLVMLHQRYPRPFLSIDGSDGLGPCVGLCRYSDIGAESYFITAECAGYLLARRDRYIFEVDAFLQHWWRHDKDVHILHHRPPLFEEEGRPSQIGYDTKPQYRPDRWMHRVTRVSNRIRDSFAKRIRFRTHAERVRTRFSAEPTEPT